MSRLRRYAPNVLKEMIKIKELEKQVEDLLKKLSTKTIDIDYKKLAELVAERCKR